MLYGSKDTIPNDDKLIRLHEAVVRKCQGTGWSHCSLAAVAAKPKLFARIAEIIKQKQPWWGAEVGIETGSPELAAKIMPAKANPFKPEDWPQVVRDGMGLMHDNGLVPACTLIVGVPEETENDVAKTLDLMDDLKGCSSLIVPLFFVPMGRLKDQDWFKDSQMTTLHRELLVKCMEHDYYWINKLIKLAFQSNWREATVRPFYNIFAFLARLKANQAGINIKM